MTRVLICDDQAIVCEGLRRILQSDPGIEVVGTANDGRQALEALAAHPVDLVLMDLKMPVMNGVLATRRISEEYPGVRVLVLTTYDDDQWVLDAIRAGAVGYLLKDTPPTELLAAIHGTMAGRSYVDPGITGMLLHNVARTSRPAPPEEHARLSEREREVLQLMTQGYSNADIARQLYLSEGTVRNYASEIFRKLGVSDRTQAVVYGLRHGLVDLG